MARIDEIGLARALTPALSAGLPGLDVEAFQNALANHEAPGLTPRGIRIPFGETEGVVCIKRAYDRLSERVSPAEFAEQIARTLQIFSRQFPGPGNNQVYPHFLLHGIELPTVNEVVGKIIDNARILHESEAAKRRFSSSFAPIKSVLGGRCDLWLVDGYADDLNGLSLKLVEREKGAVSTRMAKTGFVLDVTNKTAVIVNVQGRTKLRGDGDEIKRNDARLGRRYASLARALGRDPREFVVSEALGLLRTWGFERVKAIKPEHHVMHLAGHFEFSPRYEPALLAAGVTRDDGIYRSVTL